MIKSHELFLLVIRLICDCAWFGDMSDWYFQSSLIPTPPPCIYNMYIVLHLPGGFKPYLDVLSWHFAIHLNAIVFLFPVAQLDFVAKAGFNLNENERQHLLDLLLYRLVKARFAVSQAEHE